MTAAMRIPLLPIEQVQRSQPLLANHRVLQRLGTVFHDVVLREPPLADETRWVRHQIVGRDHRFAQPLTFTPYASAQACSARCRFCSETLQDGSSAGVMAATLRPGPGYFADLRAALTALHGVPLSYSLSGLESTDDPDWLLALLRTLQSARPGPAVEGAVLYTNGAGLADYGDRLLPALASFGLSWVEWSRHHDDEDANQRIMRFRRGQSVAGQAAFMRALHATTEVVPVKLVCVVQQGGVETAADVARYIDWAHTLGVSTVIFREFSALPPQYRRNATHRYIDAARVVMDDLLQACMDDPHFRSRYEPLALTSGYYFWNARWCRHEPGREPCEVVFEKSDYATMLEREASGLIYKLVFHANSHLCAGWQPDRNVLWSPAA